MRKQQMKSDMERLLNSSPARDKITPKPSIFEHPQEQGAILIIPLQLNY